MVRRIFTIASAVSLLLFVGTAVLWVRSYWVGDHFAKATVRHAAEISSMSGEVLYYDQVSPVLLGFATPAAPDDRWSYSQSSHPARPGTGNDTWLNRMGVALDWRERSPVMVFSDRPVFQTITRVVIPHWLVGLPFAILPALSLIRYTRRVREQRARQCRSCGYNLIGNVSGTCPECGTAVDVRSPANPPSA